MRVCLLWCFLLLPSSLIAQNNLQANVNLQFRFANPGARAQAMGGAFIGLADDTTAIFANPAGLTRISGTTVILEASQQSNDNNIPFYSGTIDQVGNQDFVFNLNDRNFSESKVSVPFFAYVNAKNRIKWGVFYSEQANFTRNFDTEGVGIPFYDRPVSQFVLDYLPLSENSVSLKLRSMGFSFSGKLTDKISAGLTLNYHQMDYFGSSVFQFPDFEALFPDVSFSPRQLEIFRELIGFTYRTMEVNGDDQQFSAYGGLLFTPNDRFSIGLAYKQLPKFDYSHSESGLDADLNLIPVISGTAEFNVPDSWGIGFSFAPTDTFLLSLDINRVLYSDLSEDFFSFAPDDRDLSESFQSVGDVTEYHVGAEYFITSTTFPIALRAGYWYEPYHALTNNLSDTQLLFRYLNDATGDLQQAARQAPFLQRFEEDQNHLTAGLGITFGEHMTFDLTGDFSERNNSISLSSIYRF